MKSTQIYYPNEKCIISGIGHNGISSLGSTFAKISIENVSVEQKFHIVENDFPIPTDGIIGRDFLTKYHCKIDYVPWCGITIPFS